MKAVPWLRIDRQSAAPLYEQIGTQIRYAVIAGRLRTGTELPSVRCLARELAINPNTVARAYRELKGDGTLGTLKGCHTFVAATSEAVSPSERRRMLEKSAGRLAADAHSLGLTRDEAIAVLATAWKVIVHRNGPRSRRG